MKIARFYALLLTLALIAASSGCGDKTADSTTATPPAEPNKQAVTSNADTPGKDTVTSKPATSVNGHGDLFTDDPNQGDPGDGSLQPWWGTYDKNGVYALEISEVSETGFWYIIFEQGGVDGALLSGGAEYYVEDGVINNLMADAGPISFSLYDDYSAIDIFAAESGELSDLRGQYTKISEQTGWLDFGNSGGNTDPGPGDPGDTIYPDNQGDPGDNVDPGIQGDPGDTGTPEWWGTFEGDEYSVSITNFDGSSFRFQIFLTSNGSIFSEGVAALYPGNNLMAEYGQMSFSLYEDFNAIDVFAPESHENERMRGHYERRE